MSQVARLASGGRIDRSRPVRFAFDGVDYHGFAGDTLASALIANGIHLVGRSFKYHRPRGFLTAGVEEPNALVQLGPDRARTEPNIRATQVELFDGLIAASQNRWPSLGFDIGAVNDLLAPIFVAGFYYKTFMWPAKAWKPYEHVIRRAAGLGRSPTLPDPDRYDQAHAHCDVLVVGAGAAGIAAALAAGRAGARVILVEQDFEAGGSLLSEPSGRIAIDDVEAGDWVRRSLAELASLAQVRVLTRTTAFGYYADNWLGLVEKVSDHLPPGSAPEGVPRQRFWKVRAGRVVLATGAIERPLTFADNDRPGIMLAGAARTYLNRFAAKVGERVLVVANNDDAYLAALDLKAAGASLAGIVDVRQQPSGPLVERAIDAGIVIYAGHSVVGTEGRKRIKAARLMRLASDGSSVERGAVTTVDCDALVSSGGWNPAVNLFSHSRGVLAFDEDRATFRPGRSFQAERSAGAAAGTWGFAEALREGHEAGVAAAAEIGYEGAPGAAPPVEVEGSPETSGRAPQRNLFLLPSDRPANRVRAFVDFQNDVTAKDLKLALREGFRSVEHVKRYTTTGMATDQGKIGNVNALGVVAETVGQPIPAIGATTFRPPWNPVTFGALAGRHVGRLYAPIRRTPMHLWAETQGAVFENVGQWKRAWYFPKQGESMADAVNREAKAVRDSVGLFDASTLGKIDVRGRDAAEFLNRVYTNAWSKLAVGSCRYGLMLGEDGMVKDDGVTTRLGETHFHMTTTTGGAAPIMAWLEEWLQTEWPELEVHLTSVTEQWAVAAIVGPKARDVLSAVADFDASNEAFPHLTMKEGHVAGVPARVFRISFSGELAYEINVPASFGQAVMERLWQAGQPYGMTPYGTETMHVLRAEKGYIIVGQDTDGTINPIDLGMSWIVSKQKPDFLGKRSLARRDMQRPDRKQLVGLKTADPARVLPEGAQIIETAEIPTLPAPMVGHVTSSYWSPNLGRSIALGLVRGGLGRTGATVHVVIGRETVAAEIVSPVFVDPEGVRLNA